MTQVVRAQRPAEHFALGSRIQAGQPNESACRMKYKHLFAAAAAALLFYAGASAQNASLKPDDLKVLEGAEWTGSLTYRDYSSDKQVEIKSNVLITRSKSDPNAWLWDFRYPLEPKANSIGEVRLSTDGKTFRDEMVVERLKLPDGGLKIVTIKPGQDNNKEATFRYTYMIGPKAFSIRKEVKTNDAEGYFERNSYKWTR
jgi:hypothetical protein